MFVDYALYTPKVLGVDFQPPNPNALYRTRLELSPFR